MSLRYWSPRDHVEQNLISELSKGNMALSSARGKLIGVIGDEVGILGLYWLVFTIHLQDHSFQDTYLFFINQLCSLGVGIHPVHTLKNYGQNQLVRRLAI